MTKPINFPPNSSNNLPHPVEVPQENQVNPGQVQQVNADELDNNIINTGNNHGRVEANFSQEINLPSSWRRQLESLLLQASEKGFGNITKRQLERALDTLDEPLPNAIEAAMHNARKKAASAMKALSELKGAQLIEAFQSNDPRVMNIVNNAIDAHQELAEKIRSIKNEDIEYTEELEDIADCCDRRASEITSAVFSLLNPPGVDEILQKMGIMPLSLKSLTSELQKCGIAERDTSAVLQAYGEAQKALNALEMSNAVSLSAEISENPVENQHLLENATNALGELSATIFNLRNQYQLSEAMEDMTLALDQHVVDLTRLGNELPALLESSKNKSVREMMIDLTPKMHGTQEVLTHFANQLTPLLDKLDDFEKSPRKVHSLDDIEKLNKDLKFFKNAIDKIVRNGNIVMPDGSKVVPDNTILEALRGLIMKSNASIHRMQKFFSNSGNQLVQASRQTFPNMHLPAELLNSDFFSKTFPILTKICTLSKEYRELEDKSLVTQEGSLDRLKALNLKFKQAMPDIVMEFQNELNRLHDLQTCIEKHRKNAAIQPGEAADDLDKLLKLPDQGKQLIDAIISVNRNKFYDFNNQVITRTEHVMDYNLRRLENIYQSHMQESDLLQAFRQGFTLRKALRENIPFSTLIESQLNGATPDMIDDLCDDCNLVDEPEKLGSGAANTVYLCSYKNAEGKTEPKVFKSEYKSSLGNFEIQLGGLGAPTLQNASLNIATKRVANLLNVGNIIPKTGVGMLHGEYGIFMDLVNGISPLSLRNSSAASGPDNGPFLSKQEILSLSDEDISKVRPLIMRKCNQLQWLDLLMAQGDRHCDNYKIAIGRDFSVNVQGIDNDECLLEWKIGLTKIKVESSYLKLLMKSDKNALDEFMNDLRARQALLEETADSLTLDTSKMNLQQLQTFQNIFGAQSFKVPDYMDSRIYNGLMDLERHPSKFQRCLPPDLTPQARTAALGRLKDMIAIAHKYNQEGKVLQRQDWLSETRQRQMMNECLRKRDEAEDRHMHITLEEDIFFRDLLGVFR